MQGYDSTNGLYERMWTSFGYLNTIGYGGHLFPILIGEMGSKFDSRTCCDVKSMADQLKWIRAEPNTGKPHKAIPVGQPAAGHDCAARCMFRV